MRIGVDIRCLMDGRRTGVEEYTLHLLRAMTVLGPQHTFVLFANSQKPMHLPALQATNVELRSFRFPNVLFNVSLKALRRPAIDTLLGGLDVLFVPSVRLAPVTAFCPVVLTLHDLSFVRHPECFSPDRRRWHRLMEPRALARRAAVVITPSSATAADVVTLYGIPRSRVRVIHPGLPSTARLASPAEHARVRERYRLPERFILFLGTLEPRKNLDSLLAAYTDIRLSGHQHALVLAGMRGWIDDAFLARVAEHPFASDIHRTGFIEDEDKAVIYQLAEVFVYPSFYEGCGFPPLEALAVGTPVVTSFNSAIPEITGTWAALVNPYDPQELAAVVADRIAHPVLVPEEVRAMVRMRYDWQRAAEETLEVLGAAVALHAGSKRNTPYT